MKIKKIKFENFRLFENLEVNFPDSNFIVLIGNNGAGKTSILDGIALSFLHFTQEVISVSERYNLPRDSWFEKDYIRIGKDESTVEISFDLNIPQNHEFFGPDESSKKISISKNRHENGFQFEKHPSGFVNELKSLVKSKKLHSLPVIAYYNVNRTVTKESDKKENQQESVYDEKLQAFVKTLNLSSPIFKDFEQWFIKQEVIENALKVNKGNLDLFLPALKNVRTAIETYLTVIEPNKYGKINILRESEMTANFTENTYEYLSLEKEGSILKFTQLSSGEKMVVLLVVDIARRLTIANENSEDALNGEGIVLIDELELHLHPNWQLKIVKALKAAFPNVQFIATTHSPKVITSLEQQDVLVLESGKVFNLNQNPLGRDDNSALEEFMDSSKRPVEIENKISEIFDKLAGKNLYYNEIEGDIEKLKSILSTDDPIFVRFNAIIERKKLLEV
jgi:predicted ATP-binding protein involved in virulence